MSTSTGKASQQPKDERSVTRTYRAAVRLGEDFITLESTITLPHDATDDDITQALDLDGRIYAAQQKAINEQVAGVRAERAQAIANGGAGFTPQPDDEPASDRQIGYIRTLQNQLGWDDEAMIAHAAEQGINLREITKAQATVFIDGLKVLAGARRGGKGQGNGRGKGQDERGGFTPQELAPGEPPFPAREPVAAAAVAVIGQGEPPL